MRFFSLRQTSQAVFLSMGLMTALGMSVSAQAATVNSAKAQATTTQKNNVARLTPANSTDGIIALVNENAILKSDLIAAIAQTQARAKAAGEPIANSAQLQSEVLNALILRELQLSLIKRVGLNPDEASINKRLEQIAKAEGLNSIAALQQRLDSAQSGSYATLRAQLIEDAAIQALQQRQITNRVRISEQDIDAFLASPEAKRLNQSEYQTVHVRVPYMDDYSRLSEAQRNDALKVAQKLRTRLLVPNVNVAEAIAASQAATLSHYKVVIWAFTKPLPCQLSYRARLPNLMLAL